MAAQGLKSGRDMVSKSLSWR